jgi:antitoxin component YwqK of YwqJK toxin-antitoxin module
MVNVVPGAYSDRLTNRPSGDDATPAKRSAAKKQVHHHKAGSVRARGQTTNEVMTGYWEWFRKDGTKMRSGYFENGEQVGEWTTYDKKGRVYKVTTMKRKAK